MNAKWQQVLLLLLIINTVNIVNTSLASEFNYDKQVLGWFYYNWQAEHKYYLTNQEQLNIDIKQKIIHNLKLAPNSSIQLNFTSLQQEYFASKKSLEEFINDKYSPINAINQLNSNTSHPKTPELDRTYALTVKDLPKVPANINSAWLKVNLPKYLEVAIDDPQKDNVLSYLYLQAYANQKASIFSEKAKIIAQGDKYLDTNGVFPTLNSSRQYREQLASHIRTNLITQFKDRFGLILLINKDFESVSFGHLVGLAALKYDLNFLTANIHGQFENKLANYNQVTDLKEVWKLVNKMQAQLYPTLYIVNKNSTSVLVEGSTTSQDIEERLINYLYKNKWITDIEYKLAQGVIGESKQDPKLLSELINSKLGK